MRKTGITLIALVVTVIVLIILAAVTINIIIGQNGILTRAQEGAKGYNAAAFKEQVEMDLQDVLTDLIVEGKTITGPSDPDFQEKMTEKGYTITENDDGSITLEKDGGTAIIYPDWKVEVEGVPAQGVVVDKTPPTFTVSYSTSSPTSSPVIVTIKTNEPIAEPAGWTRVDDTQYTKEYTVSTTETITIEDLVGNTAEVTITVENIIVELGGNASYSTTTLTPDDIVVTITTNREINTPNGWTQTGETTYTKSYSSNITEDVVIQDTYGITATVNVAITNTYTRMYDNKGLTTAPIPTGFTASVTTGETTISTGKVIKGPDSSEFVWVPVPNAAIDVTGMTDANIKAAISKETSLGYYPMAIKVSDTDYKGVLYDIAFWEGAVGAWPSNGAFPPSLSYSEPDVLTYDNCDNLASNYTNAGILEITNADEFKIRLQNEYNSMVESVKANGGFYIGRYETSLNGVNIQSKTGVAPMKSIGWYTIYAKHKTYNSNNQMESGTIWGSQWDQILIWMKDIPNPGKSEPFYVANATGMGNYSGTVKNTGVGGYKQKNIYDMAGNVHEWTMEASNTRFRIGRGGSGSGLAVGVVNISLRYGNFVGAPQYGSDEVGSRIQLYIK